MITRVERQSILLRGKREWLHWTQSSIIDLTSLKEKRDSLEQDKDSKDKNSLKLNARLKVLRPSSRDSNGSNHLDSKTSVKSMHPSENVEQLSRNNSIQSIGQKFQKRLVVGDRRVQRPGDVNSPLLIGQNVTVYQQAQQKQDIEKRLSQVMDKPTTPLSGLQLPRIGKPLDRPNVLAQARQDNLARYIHVS